MPEKTYNIKYLDKLVYFDKLLHYRDIIADIIWNNDDDAHKYIDGRGFMKLDFKEYLFHILVNNDIETITKTQLRILNKVYMYILDYKLAKNRYLSGGKTLDDREKRFFQLIEEWEN